MDMVGIGAGTDRCCVHFDARRTRHDRRSAVNVNDDDRRSAVNVNDDHAR
jgi:hypothetical protein